MDLQYIITNTQYTPISIITNSEYVADFIHKTYPNSYKLTYANRVALHSEIKKKQQPTIVILKNYSKSTLDFIRSNCKSVEVYYPENSIEFGLAIDELETMDEPTKPLKFIIINKKSKGVLNDY